MAEVDADRAAWVLRVLGINLNVDGPQHPDPAVLASSLDGLMKRVAGVTDARPQDRDEFAALETEATGSLEAGKLEIAAAAITRLRAALDALAGQEATAAAAPSMPDGPEGKVPDAEALIVRLAAARKRADRLAEPERFDGDFRAANAALDAGGASSADMVDALESRIVSAERAQEAADALADSKITLGLGAVAMGKLRLQLRALEAGRGTVISQMQAAGRDLLDADADDDPDRAEGLAALAAIEPRVPRPSPALSAALDAMADTDDRTAQAAARAAALAEVRRYRASLQADPLMQLLESSPVGSYDIYGPLTGSLAALETALAA